MNALPLAPYLFPFLIALAITGGCLIHSFARGQEPPARAFTILLLGELLWLSGYLAEITSSHLEIKLLWDNIEFLGTFIIIVSGRAFGLLFGGQPIERPGRFLLYHGAAALIFFTLVVTDPWHHWVRTGVRLEPGLPYGYLVYGFGPAVFALGAYGYLMVGLSIWPILRRLPLQQGTLRLQSMMAALGLLVPYAGTILTLTGLFPDTRRDISPYTFSLGNLFILVGLYRYRLFRLLPAAREKLLDIMPDAVVVLDPDNTILDANTAARRLAAPSETPVGLPFTRVFPGWHGLLDATVRHGSVVMLYPARQNEPARKFECTLEPITGADGSAKGKLLVLHDATRRLAMEEALRQSHTVLEQTVAERTAELQAANQQLRAGEQQLRAYVEELRKAQAESDRQREQLVQADKMASLGVMVSGVAHEINNPTNLAMLNADVLRTLWQSLSNSLSDLPEAGRPTVKGMSFDKVDGRFRELLDGVSGATMRIKKIVENLKDFARADSGTLSESIPIGRLVESAAALTRNQILRSTDRFEMRHGESLPQVRGNFQKMEQVLVNLTTNACHALPSRDRSIIVLTSYDAGLKQIRIEVRDEGIGIPAEVLPKIMDPFFTTKRDTGGTGLGLSVSYGIVREHGGELRFSSEPGKGTSATLTLPA